MTAPKASEAVRAKAKAYALSLWNDTPESHPAQQYIEHNESVFIAGALAFAERAAKLADGAYRLSTLVDDDTESEIDRAKARAGTVIAAAIRALATDAGDGSTKQLHPCRMHGGMDCCCG